MKSFLIITTLAFVSSVFANGPVIQPETLGDADAYKIEVPVKEKDAKRSFAGGKIKKKTVQMAPENKATPTEDSDSEVRYWRYSEE